MSVGVIYNNVDSVFAFNSLSKTSRSLTNSLEKISSGLRINRAADDAAGLSVSEKMRTQIYGLDQAGRNANDAIKMLRTGEGALDTVTSMLQRMRVLANQAATGNYTTSDRQDIQSEIDELVGEVDRISDYTEFNTKKILNGDATGVAHSTNRTALTATVTGRVISADYSIAVLNAGRASNVHGTTNFSSINGTTLYTLGLRGDNELHVTLDDKTRVLTLGEDDKLGDIVTKINSTGLGIKAGYHTIATGTDNGNYLTITSQRSGQKFNISFGNDPDGLAAVLGLNGGNEDASNSSSYIGGTSTTGFRYFTSGSSTVISITNITNQNVFPTNPGLGSLGQYSSTSDTFTFKELNPFAPGNSTRTNLDTQLLKGFTIKVDEDLDYGYSDAAMTGSAGNTLSFFAAAPDATITPTATAAGTNFRSIATSRIHVRDTRVNFHIGANQSHIITAEFGNVSAEALGLRTAMNTSGADYNGIASLDTGRKTEDYGLSLSVETAESAENAIPTIDKALDTVNGIRSRLGAYENSLDKTIDYLGISYENQVASESQIRDVDMAKEISNYTKQQILFQSGTSMLIQANLRPQSILQLIG